MEPNDDLVITKTCIIANEDLEWRFSGSGGPGGQHANTANTRVELRLDIVNARSLGPRQRARLLERIGPLLRVVASDERSQARNRQLALERMASKIEDALRVERPRRATKPTRGGIERRLQGKRLVSDKKRMRERPNGDD